MTFYEELGITQRATDAEIRRAYKRLTLLLHPDQQQDPEMRSLAEGQMRRLNEMVAVLGDPEERRNYDLSLRANALVVRQMPPMPWTFWFRNNVGWILVGVAFLVFVVSAIVIPNLDTARPVANAQSQVAQPGRQESTAKASKIIASDRPRAPSANISARSLGKRPRDNSMWRVAPELPSPQPPAAAHSFPAPRAEKTTSGGRRPFKSALQQQLRKYVPRRRRPQMPPPACSIGPGSRIVRRAGLEKQFCRYAHVSRPLGLHAGPK